jgi:cell division protein FtsB
MRRAVRVLLAVVTVAAVLFLFVFPVRTLIDQRNQTAQAQRQIKGLAAVNAQLSKQAAQLQTNADIEALARQRYGLVLPGDHAYTLLPSAPTTVPGGGATTTTTTTTVPAAGVVPRGG